MAINIIQCHFDNFADFNRAIRGPTSLGKPSVPPLPSNASGDIADDRTDAPIIPIRTARHWLNLYVQAQKRKEKILNPPDIETRHFGYILHSNGTLQWSYSTQNLIYGHPHHLQRHAKRRLGLAEDFPKRRNGGGILRPYIRPYSRITDRTVTVQASKGRHTVTVTGNWHTVTAVIHTAVSVYGTVGIPIQEYRRGRV